MEMKNKEMLSIVSIADKVWKHLTGFSVTMDDNLDLHVHGLDSVEPEFKTVIDGVVSIMMCNVTNNKGYHLIGDVSVTPEEVADVVSLVTQIRTKQWTTPGSVDFSFTRNPVSQDLVFQFAGDYEGFFNRDMLRKWYLITKHFSCPTPTMTVKDGGNHMTVTFPSDQVKDVEMLMKVLIDIIAGVAGETAALVHCRNSNLSSKHAHLLARYFFSLGARYDIAQWGGFTNEFDAEHNTECHPGYLHLMNNELSYALDYVTHGVAVDMIAGLQKPFVVQTEVIDLPHNFHRKICLDFSELLSDNDGHKLEMLGVALENRLLEMRDDLVGNWYIRPLSTDDDALNFIDHLPGDLWIGVAPDGYKYLCASAPHLLWDYIEPETLEDGDLLYINTPTFACSRLDAFSNYAKDKDQKGQE